MARERAMREVEGRALAAYEAFHHLAPGCATIEQVTASSANISGWAAADLKANTVSNGQPLRTVNLMTKPSMERAATAGLLMSAPRVGEDHDGWEMLEITVDSGACDTVLPVGMLGSVTLISTPASRNLKSYEVANGCTIINEGKKRCLMMTPGSQTPKGIVFQVTNVHKPLLSVGAMANAGYECTDDAATAEGELVRLLAGRDDGEMRLPTTRKTTRKLQKWNWGW